MNKNSILKVVGVFALVMMLSLAMISKYKGSKNLIKTDALKFKESYESLNGKTNESGKKHISLDIPSNNPVKIVTTKDIIKKLNSKETFAVFFGANWCPWCRAELLPLLKACKDSNIDTLYYVESSDIRNVVEYKDNNFKEIKQGDAGYMELLKRWENSLPDYQIENAKESYGKRIYLPTLVSVVKGQVSQVETGEVEELTDPRGKMSKEIFDKIYNKFKCSLKCVSDNSTTCKKNAC